MQKQWLLNKSADDMRVFEKRYYQDRLFIAAYKKWWIGYAYTYRYDLNGDILNTDHKIIKAFTNGDLMHLGGYPFPSHLQDNIKKTTIIVNNQEQADAFIEFFESFQKKHLRPSREDFQTLSTQLKLLSDDYG